VAKGIISRPFTFTALFTDASGVPIAVNTPTIEVFYYDETGVRIDLVAAGTVLPSSLPAEVGRYAYTLDPIPATLDARVQLYGVLQGVDPVSGNTLRQEREVDLYATSSLTGLRTDFVRDGSC
jgi:hypothetical protein